MKAAGAKEAEATAAGSKDKKPNRWKSRPQDGYTCHECGQVGGTEDSHWVQACPQKGRKKKKEKREEGKAAAAAAKRDDSNHSLAVDTSAGSSTGDIKKSGKGSVTNNFKINGSDVEGDFSQSKKKSGNISTTSKDGMRRNRWSIPKEGYVCKECGKVGGEPDSHWIQVCPNRGPKKGKGRKTESGKSLDGASSGALDSEDRDFDGLAQTANNIGPSNTSTILPPPGGAAPLAYSSVATGGANPPNNGANLMPEQPQFDMTPIKSALAMLPLEPDMVALSSQVTETIISLPMLEELVVLIFNSAMDPGLGQRCAELCRAIWESQKAGSSLLDISRVVSSEDGRWYWSGHHQGLQFGLKVAGLVGPFPAEELAAESAHQATDFKRVLISRCQREFEDISHIESSMVLLRQKLDALKASEDPSVPSVADLELHKLADQAMKIKHRQLAIVLFFGELFKQQMLVDKVIMVCIDKLLTAAPGGEAPNPDDIECVCKLLSKIGPNFDVFKYYERLADIAQMNVSERHVRMIYDLMKNIRDGWFA